MEWFGERVLRIGEDVDLNGGDRVAGAEAVSDPIALKKWNEINAKKRNSWGEHLLFTVDGEVLVDLEVAAVATDLSETVHFGSSGLHVMRESCDRVRGNVQVSVGKEWGIPVIRKGRDLWGLE